MCDDCTIVSCKRGVVLIVILAILAVVVARTNVYTAVQWREASAWIGGGKYSQGTVHRATTFQGRLIPLSVLSSPSITSFLIPSKSRRLFFRVHVRLFILLFVHCLHAALSSVACIRLLCAFYRIYPIPNTHYSKQIHVHICLSVNHMLGCA